MFLAPSSRPKLTRVPKEQPHTVPATIGSVLVTPLDTLTLTPGGDTGIQLPAFFVATAANGGSNSNPGTEASPFETLTKARDSMRSSGTTSRTYIRTGTHNLTSALSLNSNDVNTEWLAYPTESPVLDGQASNFNIFDCAGVSGLEFKGLTFKNNFKPVSTPSSQDDVWGIKLVNSPTATIDSCTFDTIRSGIFLSGTSDTIKILGTTFNDIGYRCVRSQDSPANGTVAGCTATNVGFDDDLDNNVAFSATHAGLFSSRRGATGWTLEYNYINRCKGGGIVSVDPGDAAHNNVTVRRNVIYSTNLTFEGEDGAAIYFGGRSAVVTTGSVFEENWCEGIGGKTLFGRVTGAAVDADKGHGVYFDDAMSGGTVQKNVCIDCVLASFFTHSGRDNTFTNNISLIVADSDNANGQLFGGPQIHQYSMWNNRNSEFPPLGGTMINNTFDKNIIVSVASPVGEPGANGWSIASYANEPGQTSYNDHTLEFETPGMTIQNNVLHNDIDLALSSSTDRGSYNRPGMGDETSTTQSDPLFKAIGSRDLQLDKISRGDASDSPAFAEGFVDIVGVTDGGTFTWGNSDGPAGTNSGYDRDNY